MNKIFSTLIITVVFAAAAFAGPYDTWAKYRDVTVNTTAGGANVPGAVANFPLLVRLTSSNAADVLDEAGTGGASLRFASENGETPYSYQIERWTAGTAAEIWVLVPSIAGGNAEAAKLRMYWDKDTTTASNGAAVFSTSNGFQAVFHMNENAGDTIRDATSNGFKGSPVVGAGGGSAAPSPVNSTTSGQYISGAYRDFPGSATAASVTVGGAYRLWTAATGTTGTGALDFTHSSTPAYTISTWINVDNFHGANGQRRGIITKTGAALSGNPATSRQYHLRAMALPNRFEFHSSPTNDSSIVVDTLAVSAAGVSGSGNQITTGQWNHIAYVRTSATEAQIYVRNTQGVWKDRNALVKPHNAASQSTINVFIGSFAGTSNAGTGFFDGKLDEVTFSNVARDTNWIKLSYETQKPGATPAVTLGSTQEQEAGPTVPGAPTGVVGTAGDGQVSVAFTAPENDGGAEITSYTVTSSPGTFTGTGAASPIIVNGLTNGVAYTFTVKATNSEGDGEASAPSSAVTPRTVPGAPTNVVGTPGSGQVSVAFDAPEDDGGAAITGYTATSSPGDFTGTGATSPIIVTGLTNGVAYTFTVTATNSEGEGDASAPSSSVTPVGVPGAPTGVAGTAGNGQVSVAFTAPGSNGGSAITGYTVTSDPGDFTGTGASSPIIVSGLANGTPYTFTVTATNSEGDGAASAPSSPATPFTVPGAPTNVVATAGSASASVAFDAPAANGAAITNYTVTSSPGDFTGTGAASPIVVSGLSNGVPYTFTVVAANAAGDGAASAPSNAATPAAAPTITYPGGPFSYPTGVRIVNLVPVKGGGPILSYSIDPANITALTNLQFNSVTGIISGTSTMPADQLFVVTAHGVGGSTDTAHVSISTTGPTLSYTGGPFSLPLGVAIEPIRPTKGPAAITGYAIDPPNITALTGLQFNTNTGIISGTPTVTVTGELFVVTANGLGGSTDTAHVIITTTGPTLSYTGGPFSFPLGAAIAPLRPTKGPATITGYAIDPPNITALTGLQFNSVTGIISGTPTLEVTDAEFEVTANGPGGSQGTTEVVITTTGPTLSYEGTPYTLTLGVAIAPIRPAKGPATITGYAIDPPNITALTGLQFNTTTGIISGVPTVVVAALPFEVTAGGLDGTEGTAPVVITTQGQAPVITYPNDGEYDFPLGAAITVLRPTKGGGPIVNYSIAPPDITARTRDVTGGLQFNTNTGAISGTPTKLLEDGDAEAFIVTAHGLGGATGTFDITINTHSTGKMNAGGPLVFRVSGSSMSYTFQVGGEAALEAVTMRIADMSGRTVWSRTVNPSTDGSTGITWDGRAQSGMKAPAGMYIVHVASRADGKTTRVVRKTVTLDAN